MIVERIVKMCKNFNEYEDNINDDYEEFYSENKSKLIEDFIETNLDKFDKFCKEEYARFKKNDY